MRWVALRAVWILVGLLFGFPGISLGDITRHGVAVVRKAVNLALRPQQAEQSHPYDSLEAKVKKISDSLEGGSNFKWKVRTGVSDETEIEVSQKKLEWMIKDKDGALEILKWYRGKVVGNQYGAEDRASFNRARLLRTALDEYIEFLSEGIEQKKIDGRGELVHIARIQFYDELFQQRFQIKAWNLKKMTNDLSDILIGTELNDEAASKLETSIYREAGKSRLEGNAHAYSEPDIIQIGKREIESGVDNYGHKQAFRDAEQRVFQKVREKITIEKDSSGTKIILQPG